MANCCCGGDSYVQSPYKRLILGYVITSPGWQVGGFTEPRNNLYEGLCIRGGEGRREVSAHIKNSLESENGDTKVSDYLRYLQT